MDFTQDQVQDQPNNQTKHDYTNSPWIHVPDWTVSSHVNSETGEPFYSVRIPKNTTIQHDGQIIDVSHYRFTTNIEPALTYGEVGSPKAVRGIHFPSDWSITLERFENMAKPDHEPVFEKTGCIEGVSPKELADGLAERAASWKQSHKRTRDEQSLDGDSRSVTSDYQKMRRSQDLSL